MRLERVKRWQWIVLSIVVGLALAYARRVDHDELPSRLGEGVADRHWFESEVQRQVVLADGSALPALSRLTVYPLSVHERGGRRTVHVVSGMYLSKLDSPGVAPATTPANANPPPATGKLRPYFFIAPVPYRPLADERAGKPADTQATVRDYLDGLAGKGVTYRYAWWADARYAAAAWVGGSVLLIGLLWPTAINLLVFGAFRRPPEEKGISLWNVKGAHAPAPRQHAVLHPASADRNVEADRIVAQTGPTSASASDLPRPQPLAPPVALASAPVEPCSVAEHAHKEFGAKRDDFYPTELKAAARSHV